MAISWEGLPDAAGREDTRGGRPRRYTHGTHRPLALERLHGAFEGGQLRLRLGTLQLELVAHVPSQASRVSATLTQQEGRASDTYITLAAPRVVQLRVELLDLALVALAHFLLLWSSTSGGAHTARKGVSSVGE